PERLLHLLRQLDGRQLARARHQEAPLEIGGADDAQLAREAGIGAAHACPSRRMVTSIRPTTIRNCSRARRRREATVPSGISSDAAISGDESPSISNITKTSARSGSTLASAMSH